MTTAVIVDYRRSPFQIAGKGAFAPLRPDDLTAQVVRGLLEACPVKEADIEDLILGCSFPEGEQGMNLARLVSLLAGLPCAVGGVTINRFCGSSMSALHYAVGQISAGAGELFVCAGVESMSRVPPMGFNPMPNPRFAALEPGVLETMGDTAEAVARRYGINRASQDAFAVESHRRAAAAQASGHFAQEIVEVIVDGTVVDVDGGIRPGTSHEGLAALKPVFAAEGTVTAGTASPLTDGASAILVASEAYARQNRLPILARIQAMAISGCDPALMGIGPVKASRKALKRAGLETGDLDVIELNEAFASQSLACIRELHLDPARTNIDGGALALGHPLGATGARLVGKAAQLLQRTGGRRALATQCIGGGQGIATVLERVD